MVQVSSTMFQVHLLSLTLVLTVTINFVYHHLTLMHCINASTLL